MSQLALIRRENLRSLDLTPKELVAKAGRTYSYWRDLMEDGKKSFGEKVARSIEESLGLPDGWLDVARSRADRGPPGAVQAACGTATLPPTLSGGNPKIQILDARPVSKMVAWKELLMPDLPIVFRITLCDDSVAPKHMPGDFVVLQRDLKPMTGDWVLVRTPDDQHAIGEYINLGDEGWASVPVNKTAERPVITSKGGAEVVAIYIGGGVSGRMYQG